MASAHRAGFEYYKAAGEKLIEAREQVGYGKFGSWIVENFGISRATAFRYMAIADDNF